MRLTRLQSSSISRLEFGPNSGKVWFPVFLSLQCSRSKSHICAISDRLGFSHLCAIFWTTLNFDVSNSRFRTFNCSLLLARCAIYSSGKTFLPLRLPNWLKIFFKSISLWITRHVLEIVALFSGLLWKVNWCFWVMLSSYKRQIYWAGQRKYLKDSRPSNRCPQFDFWMWDDGCMSFHPSPSALVLSDCCQ